MQHTTSFGVSERLEAAGYNRETMFVWIQGINPKLALRYHVEDEPDLVYLPAPTLGELIRERWRGSSSKTRIETYRFYRLQENVMRCPRNQLLVEIYYNLPPSPHLLLYIRFCQNKIFDFMSIFYSNFHIGFIYVHPKRIPDINSIVG